MKTAILIIVLALGICALFYLLFKKDSSLRKNITQKTLRILILIVVAVIIICILMMRKQLDIMINSGKQLPFLKEETYEEKEKTEPEDAAKSDEAELVIEIEGTRITLEGSTYEDYEQAENAIREKAWECQKAQLIDNYAHSSTYLNVKKLLVSCGIEEGSIQETTEY